MASVPDGATVDAIETDSTGRNRTALEVLYAIPTAELSFAQYLSMLPPIRPRYYSISSSPLAEPNVCTLTYSVLEHSITPPNNTAYKFRGAGSSFLASLCSNDSFYVSVRPSPAIFHLPDDLSVPIVMVCAGAGLAPFLGFVEERAQLSAAGVTLAPALLFIGCRHPDRDMLYSAKLREQAASGGTKIHYAFSQAPSLSEGCKYVQDRLLKERSAVIDHAGLRSGKGKIFVCGETRVLEGVAATMKWAFAELEDGSPGAADKRWNALRSDGERYACEVFD